MNKKAFRTGNLSSGYCDTVVTVVTSATLPPSESQQGVTVGNWQLPSPQIIYLQQGVGREERKEYNC